MFLTLLNNARLLHTTAITRLISFPEQKTGLLWTSVNTGHIFQVFIALVRRRASRIEAEGRSPW
jgi:hypothetical protein